jgi:hypothetical protein
MNEENRKRRGIGVESLFKLGKLLVTPDESVAVRLSKTIGKRRRHNGSKKLQERSSSPQPLTLLRVAGPTPGSHTGLHTLTR